MRKGNHKGQPQGDCPYIMAIGAIPPVVALAPIKKDTLLCPV